MPLCWAHAEYVILVRSHKNGVSFDRIEPVYQRYVEAVTGSKTEMWTLAHQPSATSRPGRASGTRSSIASSRRSARTGVASRSSATRRWWTWSPQPRRGQAWRCAAPSTGTSTRPGLKVSDADVETSNLHGATFHGEWNYSLLPRRRLPQTE